MLLKAKTTDRHQIMRIFLF